MKTIAILSGKGGVGKSSLTASLALLMSKKNKIVAADCDVDAANLALLFGIKKFKNSQKISTNLKAYVNSHARECKNIVEACAFSAISWDEKKQLPKINKFLCEGCGVCRLLCPRGITLKKVKNAAISQSRSKYGFTLVSGQLQMGESGSGKIVNVVKEKALKIAREQKADFLLVDSSPGIGCPVIASIKGCDYILAVTEATPVAFKALKRVLKVVEHFKINYGIIINKSDLNRSFARKIEKFAGTKNVKIIAKIPYSLDFVKAMVEMKPVVEAAPRHEKTFQKIIKVIENINF